MTQNWFRTILLIVFGLLFIVGIGLFAMQQGSSSGDEAGNVVVWGTVSQDVMDLTIRNASLVDTRFQAVEYQEINPATYQQILTDALASGGGPDLVFITDETAVADERKFLFLGQETLTPNQFYNTFVDSANVFVTGQGVEAVPILVDPLVLYWNRDMLATAGFTSPPRTWEDVASMAEQISQKDESGSLEKGGIAFGDYRNIRNAKQILVTLIMQAGNPIVIRDENGRLVSTLSPESGGSGSLTEKALELFTTFSNPSSPAYSWSTVFPEAQTAFAQEKAAMYVGYASERSDLLAKNPNLNFSTAALPQFAGRVKSITTARVYALAIPRTAVNPTGAFTIAYAMASPDFASALSEATGMATALRDFAKAEEAEQSQDVRDLNTLIKSNPKSVRELIYYQAGLARSWLDPNPIATAQIFYGMIETVVTGAADAGEAGSRADQSIKALLGL